MRSSTGLEGLPAALRSSSFFFCLSSCLVSKATLAVFAGFGAAATPAGAVAGAFGFFAAVDPFPGRLTFSPKSSSNTERRSILPIHTRPL